MVTLTNRTKVAQTFNIPCRPGCAGADCLCTEVTTRLAVAMDDGKVGVKEVTRRLPGAITIRAAESLSVEPWVADAPSIARAVASKVVRLVKP